MYKYVYENVTFVNKFWLFFTHSIAHKCVMFTFLNGNAGSFITFLAHVGYISSCYWSVCSAAMPGLFTFYDKVSRNS